MVDKLRKTLVDRLSSLNIRGVSQGLILGAGAILAYHNNYKIATYGLAAAGVATVVGHFYYVHKRCSKGRICKY